MLNILSHRGYEHWPSWDLVYEWEDAISKHYPAKIYHDTYRRQSSKKLAKYRFLDWFILPFGKKIVFHMTPQVNNFADHHHNIIPCIIDFYLKSEEELNAFYRSYAKHKLVLISSKEAYDFLIQQNCPLNIQHWALSISNIYEPKSEYRKEYDLVMVGRQNPILEGFVHEYAKRHRDFVYVYRIIEGTNFHYYSSKGEFVGDINNREDYIKLMRKSRIGLYSTANIDSDNGIPYNQVTPRFLELISSGCHIIARYKKNSDTDYYGLEQLCKSIDTYEQFEEKMDYARTHRVDTDIYRNYLKKHYTSARVEQLKQILLDL